MSKLTPTATALELAHMAALVGLSMKHDPHLLAKVAAAIPTKENHHE